MTPLFIEIYDRLDDFRIFGFHEIKGFLDPVKSVKSMSNELFRFEATGFYHTHQPFYSSSSAGTETTSDGFVCAESKARFIGVYGEQKLCSAVPCKIGNRTGIFHKGESVIEDGRFTAGYDDLFYLLPTGKLHDLFDDRAVLVINTLPKKAVHPRRIAVVGGGAAGMEAAREAVECGHTVEIFEKSKVLGGELNAAGAHAFKEEIHQLRDWYIAELKEKNVPIHMETEFTPDMADSGKYDTVILAVGATPIMPASIEGVEKAISAVELLENHSDVGETVVVVGGGMVGCETAVDLSKAGKKVTLVEALPAVLSSEYVTTAHKMMLQDMMEDQKIEIMAAHKIVAVTDEGAVVEPTDGGERMTIPADKVVLSIGLKPNPSMALDLVGRGVEIYEIGSARRAGNVITAIHDAFNVVYNFE